MRHLNPRCTATAELKTAAGSDLEASLRAVIDAEAAKLAADKVTKTTVGYSFTQISPADDPAGFMNTVKHALMTPRKQFYYQCGNLVVQTDGLDCDMGPKPVSCEVTNMMNGYFMVNYTVTVCLAACTTNPIPSAVVSIKWVQSESFDENWYSTITTRGKLIVRSDLKTTADSFRNLCVPGMLTDYIRTHVDWTPNEAGTELGFSVTDKEQYLMPPYGATDAEGSFTVVVSKGSLRVGQADITLKGPKGGKRADLMAIATRMAMSKMQSEGASYVDNKGILVTPPYHGVFREDLFKNQVTVQLQCALQPIRKVVDRGAIRTVGNTPFVTTGQIPLAPPIRSRLIALLSPAFYDVCSASPGTQPQPSTVATPKTFPNTTTNDTASSSSSGSSSSGGGTGVAVPGTQLVTGGTGGMRPSASVVASSVAAATPVGPTAYGSTYGPPSVSITVVDAVPDPTSPVTDAVNLSDNAPYDSYVIESTYIYDAGVVQLPGTGVGPNGKNSVFPRVHGGMAQLEVTWSVTRRVLSPIIPRFPSPNSNFVGLKSTCTPVIDIGADGEGPIYTVSGHYKYGVVNPDLVNAAAAIPPFLSDAAAQASPLAAAFFSDRIIWQFQGQGPNPFTTTMIDQKPGQQVAQALGAFLGVAGIPVPPPFTAPPPVAGAG